MSLDTTSTEASILAEARTVLSRTYVTEYPEPTSPRYPYAIIYFGEPVRSGRDRHITTTRDDVLRGYMTVRVVSTDDASANVIKNRLKDALVGFSPADSGELYAEGGTAYSTTTTTTKPNLFNRELYFTYQTNLTGAD